MLPLRISGRSSLRFVVSWLCVCATLAYALIVLGGVVRLTRSGLSITEWQPIAGVIPPMGDVAWNEAFSKYRATPEFVRINPGMTIDGFKQIFVLEYAHRLLGRITGLFLIVPLALLLVRRRMALREAAPLLAVLGAGLGQAGLGWIMVKSGLIDVPHVNPYLLASHLVVGIALFASLVWMIARKLPRGSDAAVRPSGAARLGIGALIVATVTVAWGGLMAGSHAGHVFPTFPRMGDAWVPVPVGTLARLAATDGAAIHFVHRAAAVILAVACAVTTWSARSISKRTRLLGALMVALLAFQVALGALVVLRHVPVTLASLHQANAVAFVGTLTALVAELRM